MSRDRDPRDNDDEAVILAPHGRPPAISNGAALLPCRWCDTPTAHSTLSTYGARCYPCYLAYCREAQPSPDVGDKRNRGSRDWARALKHREESGERLSPAQRDMWREAIGRSTTVDAE